jgi:hypothetical protein
MSEPSASEDGLCCVEFVSYYEVELAKLMTV